MSLPHKLEWTTNCLALMKCPAWRINSSSVSHFSWCATFTSILIVWSFKSDSRSWASPENSRICRSAWRPCTANGADISLLKVADRPNSDWVDCQDKVGELSGLSGKVRRKFWTIIGLGSVAFKISGNTRITRDESNTAANERGSQLTNFPCLAKSYANEQIVNANAQIEPMVPAMALP